MHPMDTTTPLPPADEPPVYQPPPIGPRRLMRSTQDRMIGGVCGGLAEHLRIDPTIVRIGAIALTFLGGVGIVAYLIAWIVVPEDPRPGNADSSDRVVPLSLLAVVAILGFFSLFDGNPDLPVVAFVLLALGAVLVWGGRGGDDTDTVPPSSGPPGPSTPDSPSSTTLTTLPPPPPPPPPAPPSLVAGNAAPPPPAQARRRWRFPWRSFTVAIGGLFIAAGAFAAAVVLSEDVAPTVVLGSCLAALGIVIAAGAWLGRTRPLVPAGLLLLGGLATVAIIDVPLDGGFADRTIVADSVEDIAQPEHLTAGRLVFDLRQLDLLGDEPRLEATVAAGELVVIVPPTATIEVHADVGVGNLVVLGREREGIGPELDQVVDGSGEGRIELDLRVGAGRLEVRRAG
jgi:phage shock protein PspC (stress-responsive transcriptional regulator)